MVGGRAAASSVATAVSQWAETTRTACGRPIAAPNPARNSRAGDGVRGSVGAPWETKTTGRRDMRESPCFVIGEGSYEAAPPGMRSVHLRRSGLTAYPHRPILPQEIAGKHWAR